MSDVWETFIKFTRESVVDVEFSTAPSIALSAGAVSVFPASRVRCSENLIQSLKLTSETLPRTFEQWFELYHPDDYAKSLTVRRLAFGGTSDAFSVERRLYCGDGRYRWFRLDAVCLRDESGTLERLVGVEKDISPQKSQNDGLAEQLARIRELESRIALLKDESEAFTIRLAKESARADDLEKRLHLASKMLDASSDLLFHRDAAGRLTLCNDAFARAAAHDPSLPREATSVRNEGECEYRDAHGRIRRLSARVCPFPDHYGRIEGEIGAFSDVTEAGETEIDIARLKRLLGKTAFAASTWEGAEAFGEERSLGEGFDEKIEAEDFEGVELDREDCDVIDSREILGGFLNGALRSLRKAAEASDAAKDGLLPARAEQLESLLAAAGNAELEVGVVGITSSGKSTFINAMMGERLLPEETRATTNLVVRCRKGAERSVTVVSKDGTVRTVAGSQLTAAWMETLASERLNPANEQEIALLEWTSPGAALPEGLVLLDTPGLDACAFPEHSELVLRRLLPSLDIVLYITTIRNRFKSADLELLNAVLEQNQRVVFLLSQIDLEQDDTEGGQVVRSRREKLSSDVRALREDIGRVFGEDDDRLAAIRRAAVVPVSSRLAATYFYDRASAGWAASNFGPLIRQLEVFRGNLSRCRFEARARRALTLLSRTETDLGLALGALSAESAEAEGGARLEKIRVLRDAQRWASAEISAVRNEWRRLLDPEHHVRRLGREIESAGTVKTIKDRYERACAEWSGLTAQMTARMDRSRQACRDILRRHGIVPRDRTGEVLDIKGEMPAFYRYVLHEAREKQVRGWFEDLQFWPRYQTFFRQDVDRDGMLAAAKELLSDRLALLSGHLAWWENRMREDYCVPLYDELTREEAALADIRRAATDVSVSRSTLRGALNGIREAERGIGAVMADLSLPEIDPEELFAETLFEHIDALPSFPDDEETENGVFAPLFAAFHEQNIQSRFLETDALRLASERQGRRRVVLLGLRRHDAMRLVSRLAHDASLETTEGEDVDERKWIFCGATPPDLPHVRLVAPDSLLRELELLVAPGDALCSSDESIFINWSTLFDEWVPVVHLDLARVDSGLSDLARAPYGHALALSGRWVAASGQGALFNGRLADLLTDVPDRVEDFVRQRNYRSRPDWFVYENYDARCTDFMKWGRGHVLTGTTPEVFLRQWTESGHDFRFPFTELRLRRALEGARRKINRTAMDTRKTDTSERGEAD